MDNLLNSISAKMQLKEDQDGTLKGGFVSITGGRFRVIVNTRPPDSDPAPAEPKWDNTICLGNNVSCENAICPGTTNTIGKTFADCINGYCHIVSSSGNSTI